MNDKIDCTADIKRAQAVQAITQCINSIGEKLQLNPLELRNAVEIVQGNLNKICMELYATALAEMAVQKQKDGDENADLD